MDEHLFLVTYDIADGKRWRSIFRLMQGYGEWLQLSVFQCRLTRAKRIELQARLEDVLHRDQDHVLLIDVGPADKVDPRITSLGKVGFAPIVRGPQII